jgi:hypothetical protein
MVEIEVIKWDKKQKFFNKADHKKFREKTSQYTVFRFRTSIGHCRVEDNTFKGAALNYLVMNGSSVNVFMSVCDYHRQGVSYAYTYNNTKYDIVLLKSLFNLSSRKTRFWKDVLQLIKSKDDVALDKFLNVAAISERLFLELTL